MVIDSILFILLQGKHIYPQSNGAPDLIHMNLHITLTIIIENTPVTTPQEGINI